MNAAVRTLGYRIALTGAGAVAIKKEHWLMLGLGSLMLLSAIGLVYLKDVNRRLFSELETLQANNIQLHNQATQYLLQKIELANQDRVTHLARSNLNMEMPIPKAVVMIRS